MEYRGTAKKNQKNKNKMNRKEWLEGRGGESENKLDRVAQRDQVRDEEG